MRTPRQSEAATVRFFRPLGYAQRERDVPVEKGVAGFSGYDIRRLPAAVPAVASSPRPRVKQPMNRISILYITILTAVSLSIFGILHWERTCRRLPVWWKRQLFLSPPV